MTAEKKTGTKHSSGSMQAREQVLEMLRQDHKRVRKSFKDFEDMDPASQADECRQLVEQTCGELLVHAALEEELFYPALRQALKEQDLLDEAEVEHASAKQLIEQLQAMDGQPMDGKFAATFTVLGEYVRHHVKEEEGELFEQCEKAKLDWAALAQQMQERRMELADELLPQQSMQSAGASGAAAGAAG